MSDCIIILPSTLKCKYSNARIFHDQIEYVRIVFVLKYEAPGFLTQPYRILKIESEKKEQKKKTKYRMKMKKTKNIKKSSWMDINSRMCHST